jgi:flavin reductase (DIM6/NTAB) family NADH-FMN oxidoreductase RutF
MLLKPFMRENFIPLPITFISTVSKDGVRNIAPYSCIMPVLRPLAFVCFASAHKRDTLRNVRETGEFVVNLVGVDFTDKVIPTAKYTPAEVDEFEIAGLEEKASETISVPGIKGAYAWMECTLHKEYSEPNYVLVVGLVQRLEVSDAVLKPDGSLDVSIARPLMMIGGLKEMNYCTVVETGKADPYGAMFPDGKDPLAHLYGV